MALGRPDLARWALSLLAEEAVPGPENTTDCYLAGSPGTPHLPSMVDVNTVYVNPEDPLTGVYGQAGVLKADIGLQLGFRACGLTPQAPG